MATAWLTFGAGQQNKQKEKMKQTAQTEHYTFELSDKVTRQKVTFKNRYGITLTGDLYLPRNAGNNLSAIAISGPFGAVNLKCFLLFDY